ncbi:hypothetical protein CY34DRAFT_435033 [Suillus luteus UH-Slu-Lm8-n1]|uniref:Uncharacterized protein n=1 Tax=Suillus luteus UH-Slu-Lm8-n1 TaxID=930992 RepID=A0A0D0B4X4_9AGAM|nr:hypothetical protein CY34DRAFT_435033 [Suillus luteus UH-Slu-Lm8-n1]
MRYPHHARRYQCCRVASTDRLSHSEHVPLVFIGIHHRHLLPALRLLTLKLPPSSAVLAQSRASERHLFLSLLLLRRPPRFPALVAHSSQKIANLNSLLLPQRPAQVGTSDLGNDSDMRLETARVGQQTLIFSSCSYRSPVCYGTTPWNCTDVASLPGKGISASVWKSLLSPAFLGTSVIETYSSLSHPVAK